MTPIEPPDKKVLLAQYSTAIWNVWIEFNDANVPHLAVKRVDLTTWRRRAPYSTTKR